MKKALFDVLILISIVKCYTDESKDWKGLEYSNVVNNFKGLPRSVDYSKQIYPTLRTTLSNESNQKKQATIRQRQIVINDLTENTKLQCMTQQTTMPIVWRKQSCKKIFKGENLQTIILAEGTVNYFPEIYDLEVKVSADNTTSILLIKTTAITMRQGIFTCQTSTEHQDSFLIGNEESLKSCLLQRLKHHHKRDSKYINSPRKWYNYDYSTSNKKWFNVASNKRWESNDYFPKPQQHVSYSYMISNLNPSSAFLPSNYTKVFTSGNVNSQKDTTEPLDSYFPQLDSYESSGGPYPNSISQIFFKPSVAYPYEESIKPIEVNNTMQDGTQNSTDTTKPGNMIDDIENTTNMNQTVIVNNNGTTSDPSVLNESININSNTSSVDTGMINSTDTAADTMTNNSSNITNSNDETLTSGNTTTIGPSLETGSTEFPNDADVPDINTQKKNNNQYFKTNPKNKLISYEDFVIREILNLKELLQSKIYKLENPFNIESYSKVTTINGSNIQSEKKDTEVTIAPNVTKNQTEIHIKYNSNVRDLHHLKGNDILQEKHFHDMNYGPNKTHENSEMNNTESERYTDSGTMSQTKSGISMAKNFKKDIALDQFPKRSISNPRNPSEQKMNTEDFHLTENSSNGIIFLDQSHVNRVNESDNKCDRDIINDLHMNLQIKNNTRNSFEADTSEKSKSLERYNKTITVRNNTLPTNTTQYIYPESAVSTKIER